MFISTVSILWCLFCFVPTQPLVNRTGVALSLSCRSLPVCGLCLSFSRHFLSSRELHVICILWNVKINQNTTFVGESSQDFGQPREKVLCSRHQHHRTPLFMGFSALYSAMIFKWERGFFRNVAANLHLAAAQRWD